MSHIFRSVLLGATSCLLLAPFESYAQPFYGCRFNQHTGFLGNCGDPYGAGTCTMSSSGCAATSSVTVDGTYSSGAGVCNTIGSDGTDVDGGAMKGYAVPNNPGRYECTVSGTVNLTNGFPSSGGARARVFVGSNLLQCDSPPLGGGTRACPYSFTVTITTTTANEQVQVGYFDPIVASSGTSGLGTASANMNISCSYALPQGVCGDPVACNGQACDLGTVCDDGRDCTLCRTSGD